MDGKQFHRDIIFTKAKLNGYYRYKDEFQIFPAELLNMPVSKMQEHYPNILEYWTSDEDIVVRDSEFEELQELYTLTATTTTKRNRILSLLNAFSNNLFFSYNGFGGIWGMPMPYDIPGEEANAWSSQWCMKIFHFPDLPDQLRITSFSALNTPEVKRKRHLQFYTVNPNLDHNTDEDILLPTTLDLILHQYYKQSSETREILDNAIGFLVSAFEILDTKKTLALLSMFTSLETMVNLEYREVQNERCESCGQLKYSISKKFRAFLLKYVAGDDSNKKKFNAYYSLRSKIVHMGARLKTEQLFAEVTKEESKKELIDRLEILQMTKLAIANWLLMKDGSLQNPYWQ